MTHQIRVNSTNNPTSAVGLLRGRRKTSIDEDSRFCALFW